MAYAYFLGGYVTGTLLLTGASTFKASVIAGLLGATSVFPTGLIGMTAAFVGAMVLSLMFIEYRRMGQLIAFAIPYQLVTLSAFVLL